MISVTNSCCNKKAVTFIELLFVIIIIGVVAAVAIPQVRNTFNNLEFESFVRDIYYLSRYLQGAAIGEGKIYYLKYSIDSQDERGEFQALFYKGEEGFESIPGRFGMVYKAPQGMSISIEPSESSGTYFYPDGSIDKISIKFENQQKKQLSLIIQGASGGIKIQ